MRIHFERAGCRATYWCTAGRGRCSSHGYLGVQLFFGISGYCIAAAVYGMRGKEKPVAAVHDARVAADLSAVLVEHRAGCDPGSGHHAVRGESMARRVSFTTGDRVATRCCSRDRCNRPTCHLVYWSLSIEIQFYVLMSFCLLNFRWAECIWFSCNAQARWCSRRNPRCLGRCSATGRSSLADRGVLLDHGRASLAPHLG